MQRCADIAQKIIFRWQRTNRFEYSLRATSPVEGLEISELRKRKFALGAGEEDFGELPLDDVLAIFALIERQVQALKQFQGNLPPSYRTSIQVGPDFSDDQAARILAQLRIETPHDPGKYLAVAVGGMGPDGRSQGESPLGGNA
jgi:hypothetical protein